MNSVDILREVVKVRTKDFYPTMLKWCEGHSFPEISPSVLPEYTLVICDNKGDHKTLLYSVCFYNTDSNLAWLGWELSNPDASKEDKEGALNELLKGAEKYAKSLGYQVVFTTSNTKPVVNSLKELNYKEGDTNVNHYLKIL